MASYLDKLTTEQTAFNSFAELCRAAEVSGYSPTLRPLAGRSERIRKANADRAHLAEMFDCEMESRGLTPRAWMGSR